jgi:ubiquitin C-terminal hydrolase
MRRAPLNASKLFLAQHTLVLAWNEFIHEFCTSHVPILRPHKLIHAIYGVICATTNKSIPNCLGQTGDTEEIFILMIEALHSVLKSSIDTSKLITPPHNMPIARACFEESKQCYRHQYSPVVPLFYGMQWINKKPLVPPPLNKEAGKGEIFMTLDIAIPPHSKTQLNFVRDCMASYVAQETIHDVILVEENLDKGMKEVRGPILRSTSFYTFPNVLVVNIKRMTDIRGRKNQHQISFPIDRLDLTEFQVEENKRTSVFQAQSVCWHTGGHYLSYVRDGAQWLCCNDTNVSICSNIESVAQSPHTSCVIYRRISA